MRPSSASSGLPWLLALGSLATGCLDPIELEPTGYQYRSVVRWTGNGVPHILAADLPSAAYGQGYAFAKLNACVLADQILKVRSERSLFLGRGEDDANVRSDLVHKSLRIYEKAEQGLPEQPEDITQMLTAYADGYNDYIDAHRDTLPCGGEPWLRPISSTDLLAHYVELGMLASSRQAHELIWEAQPPGSGLQREPKTRLEDLRANRPGSNGWAIGRERSANGHGMVMANPHFPWEGELKLYESHLKVPGRLDVYGASLMGVVGVLIGFNQDVAWTHTVSDGQRLTLYQLELDQSDPTTYIYDGEPRKMTAESFEVQVLEDDGTISTASHTFYRTHFGPMVALPGFGWLPDLAFSLRDANDNNQAMIGQFLGMNFAGTMDEFQRVHEEVAGIPWVNTIAASRDGRAWYIDATPTPNLSQEAIDRWLELSQPPPEGDLLVSTLASQDLVLLPGNDSTFEWVEEPGARDPGLVPVADLPQLERADFVFNANDSHWMTNPLEPLTGFSPLHGFERTPRSPRTRMNAVTLLDEDGSMSGSDRAFDLDELRAAALSNRGMMAELLRDAVVQRCRSTDTWPHQGVDYELAPACDVLAAWDLRLDLDSRGAVLWRELIGDFDGSSLVDAGLLFAEPFDPGPEGDATPAVATPHGLAPPPEAGGNDRVLTSLTRAMSRLSQAGFALDVSLREAQYTIRAGERIPIHGGGSSEGVTNLITYSVLKTTVPPPLSRGEVINEATDLTEQGYVVNYGSSFVMAMRFTDGAPEGYAFVTYGQSDDPSSPYHRDQTHRFADKDWRKILYTEPDIEADPDLQVEVIFGFPRDPVTHESPWGTSGTGGGTGG